MNRTSKSRCNILRPMVISLSGSFNVFTPSSTNNGLHLSFKDGNIGSIVGTHYWTSLNEVAFYKKTLRTSV